MLMKTGANCRKVFCRPGPRDNFGVARSREKRMTDETQPIADNKKYSLKLPKPSRFTWIFLACGGIFLGSWFFLGDLLSFEDIKSIGSRAAGLKETAPLLLAAGMLVAHFLSGLTALPTKGVFTLLGGALLGPYVGAATTLLGIGLGTTILFFVSRRYLRAWVQSKLKDTFRWVEEKLAQRPIRALIGLRLMITLPYGPITLATALSRVRYRDFVIGTIIGDLPIVLLYSFAGERLYSLATVSDAVSPTTVAILLSAGAVFLIGTFFGARLAPSPSKDKPAGDSSAPRRS